MKRFECVCAQFLIATVFVSGAWASLQVEDHFRSNDSGTGLHTYQSGLSLNAAPINNTNGWGNVPGGMGWSPFGWTYVGYTVQSAGLTYADAGGTLNTEGGSVQSNGTEPANGVYRRYQSSYSETELWFSLLGSFKDQFTSQSTVTFAGIDAQLTSSPFTLQKIGGFRITATGAVIAKCWGAEAEASSEYTEWLDFDTSYLFVGKLEFNVGGDNANFGDDRFTVWVNPKLGVSEANLDANCLAKSTIENVTIPTQLAWGAMSWQMNSPVNSSFDEIRIGSSLVDVLPYTPVPEPAGFSLVLAGLLILRRRFV
jgi:hypothetical protein